MGTKKKFKDVYTRKVSGEMFEYEAEYTSGPDVHWRARIYKDDDLKGQPSGTILASTMKGEGLRQYIIGLIESLIEKGLGVAE